MATSQWMICLGHGGWQVVHDGSVAHTAHYDEQPEPDEQVAHMADVLTQRGYRGEPILLALASDCCLATTLAVDSPQQVRKRQALLFRLEESLPWEAEEVVADFVGHADAAFTVAVQHVWLKPWLDAMKSSRLRIQSVTPLVLLGLAHHLSSGDWPSSHAVLWAHAQGLDLLIVQDGKPQDWRVVPPSGTTLVQILQVISFARTQRLPLVCYDVGDELVSVLRELPDIDLLDHPTESPMLHAAAAETSRLALTAEHDLWIELRRDALDTQDRFHALHGRVRFFAAAACFFCLALATAFLVRAYRYDLQVERVSNERAKIYLDVFPEGNSVPPGVRSRLASELAKLKGIRGESTELTTSPAALDVLYEVLASLPNGMRYRVLEIRIDDGRLDLNGEVRGHSDADQIATSLRDHGFEVAAPFTQRQTPQSVIVRITAHRAVKENSTAKTAT